MGGVKGQQVRTLVQASKGAPFELKSFWEHW